MNIFKNTKGYSLIEMTALIAIIGITAMILIPKVSNTNSDANLITSARELLTNIRYARDKAITLKTNYKLEFDNSNLQYYIYPTSSTVKTVVNLKDGIRLDSSSTKTVTFTKSGNISGGLTFKLTNGDKIKSISIDSVGRVNMNN